MIHFNKIVIVGCGLIGGSLAMAFRSHGMVNRIVGVDIDTHGLDKALTMGIIDEAADSLENAVLMADLVVLAVPVQQTIRQLELLAGLPLKRGCIITDVSSTKKEICGFANKCLPKDTVFVGGHPMAGSEKTGITAASPRLFENAVYILTPGTSSDTIAVDKLRQTFEQIRAQVLVMDPAQHDQVVAAISHIPHVVAALLVDQVADLGQNNPLYSRLAAGGFRDVTRIASGSPVMWRDILLTNREPILQLLRDWVRRTKEVANWLEEANPQDIETFFTRTREWRDSLPAKAKGAARIYYEMTIDVEDKPGIIGKVATILGEHGINLRNIGILENREEVNGQLLLSFSSYQDQAEAMHLLLGHGYKVHVRE
ncbi:prephenate dehydrogenase [Effusibacillus lacus]|uniref:Prephenate dehydrogenase n=1 Tax=Effusibacillus lacus TaxID=1348429 RepID=A0A292YML9_9BACL|nr:prephenate dehydrogenase [Effusibacillus lacus]TCS75309.1 prephenate dehydrogenase [Effusibacillus lacus]GAX89745.1 prephenate dehydrogenase [Effusibacillus lacus]